MSGVDSVSLPATRQLAIRLRLLDPCLLPAFYGPEVRGMLGQGLKLAFCENGSAEPARCPGCPTELAPRCAYARLFEPRGRDACGEPPRPFVVAVAPPARSTRRLPAGSVLEFRLTALGPSSGEGDRYVAALRAAGAAQLLGRGQRARFEVEPVDPGMGAAADSPAEWHSERVAALSRAGRLRLRMSSPLALRESQRQLQSFDLDALLRHAGERLRRLASVSTPPAGAWTVELPQPPVRGLVVEQARVRRVGFERLGRGGRRQPMEGIVGEATLAGDLFPVLPLLVAAERLHVGRLTSFGFGRIELSPSPSQERPRS